MVVVAASLFGTLGYLSREAAALGMGALPFVFWRAGLASAALGGAGSLTGGGVGRFRQLPDGRQRALLLAALLGAALNVAMFLAFARMAIALALTCFYTFPAMVTLAAVPLFGERLELRRLLALVLSSAGLLLVLLAPSLSGGSGLAIDPIGVGLALVAAMCQAGFVLTAGRGFRPMSALDISTFVVATAVVVTGALIVVTGEFGGLLVPFSDPRAWPWVLLSGIAAAAIPTTLFVSGIARIGPSRAAILMTFEPLVGVTLAALLLGERPVPLQLVGGAMVLAAAILLQAAPGRAPEEAETRVV